MNSRSLVIARLWNKHNENRIKERHEKRQAARIFNLLIFVIPSECRGLHQKTYKTCPSSSPRRTDSTQRSEARGCERRIKKKEEEKAKMTK